MCEKPGCNQAASTCQPRPKSQPSLQSQLQQVVIFIHLAKEENVRIRPFPASIFFAKSLYETFRLQRESHRRPSTSSNTSLLPFLLSFRCQRGADYSRTVPTYGHKVTRPLIYRGLCRVQNILWGHHDVPASLVTFS
jgi:hypothetical protein